MGHNCSACNKSISPKEFEWSMKKFNRPLCYLCQKTTNYSHSSNVQGISLKQRQEQDDTEIDVVAGVQKAWKGVSKIVKERSITGERDFNKWISDWRHANKGLDFSLENKHFFLGGSDIDDFTKKIIGMAEKTIFVANPFVEACYLTDYLIDNARKGTEIKIVTRQPDLKNGPQFQREKEKKKAECHSGLREIGIVLRYDDRIHSKIIVVDDKVAVVSSMNFYSGSSGGASNEAGIVTIDDKVVNSASNYIKKFF